LAFPLHEAPLQHFLRFYLQDFPFFSPIIAFARQALPQACPQVPGQHAQRKISTGKTTAAYHKTKGTDHPVGVGQKQRIATKGGNQPP